jgi:large subunit ribosomal protein L29
MARPSIADVRKLNDGDINAQIDATRRELFDLRFQQATRRLENPHRFKEARIKLAHLLTVQGERQRAATATSAS